MGLEREAALQKVLDDPQVQTLKARLEKRGHKAQLDDTMVFELARDAEKGLEVFIPFTREANLGFIQFGDQSFAMAQISYQNGKKRIILKVGEQDRTIKLLGKAERKRIFQQLRKNPQYKEFEEELTRSGRVVLEEKIEMALDETQKKVFIPILTARNISSGTESMHTLVVNLDPGEWDYSGIVVYDTSNSSVDIQRLDPGGGGIPGGGSFWSCLWVCLGPDVIWVVEACFIPCYPCTRVPSLFTCGPCILCISVVLGFVAYCVYNCI